MLHVVELPIGDGNLADPMNRVRAWLDHHRFEPDGFQFTEAGDRPGLCRVFFKFAAEAQAFAEEPAGCVQMPPTAEAGQGSGRG